MKGACGRRVFGRKVFGQRVFGRKGFGRKAFGQRVFGRKGFGRKVFGRRVFGRKGFGRKVFGRRVFGRKGFGRLGLVVLIFSLLLGVFGVAAACENEAIGRYAYSVGYFDYYEYQGSGSGLYTTNSTETRYATYFFDEEISTKKCDRFVTFAEQVLDFLAGDGAERELTFFVSDDIGVPRAEIYGDEVFLYFSSKDTKSVELISFVLLGLNTNTLNYGLAYGMGAKIHDELGWGRIGSVSNSSIKDFLKKDANRFVLDLTYPVFNGKLATVNQIKYAKSISLKLADYIEKTHGRVAFDELLEADLTFDMSFDNLFYGYMNEWLVSLRLEPVEIASEVLRCVPYTLDFPYILLTYSCEYYMDKDWQDTATKESFFYMDFVLSYATIKDFLLEAESSYAGVRDFFDYEQNERALVFLKNRESHLYGGIAYDDYFIINSLFALTHEYTHLISQFKYDSAPSWMLESIAYYCDAVFSSCLSDEFASACLDKDAYIEFVGDYLGEIGAYVLYNYMDKTDNPNYYLRFSEAYYYVLFFERGIDLHEQYENYLGYYHFTTAFSDFLVKTYGKEKYIDLYKWSGILDYAYDKPQSEILDEFLAYLYDIFN